MRTSRSIEEFIEDVVHAGLYAVLATEGDGRPYASLIAVTPAEGFLQIIFATYRNTRKYANLKNNQKVAILFEDRVGNRFDHEDIHVLTAFGRAEEVDKAVSDALLQAHLLRHPELESFLLSQECAIFRVSVEACQVVWGIDDIDWWSPGELDASIKM
jgi:heme iron utilization protein